MEISRSIVFLEGVMPTAFLTSMVLAAEERTALERWARRTTTAQALAFRARVILASREERAAITIDAMAKAHPNRTSIVAQLPDDLFVRAASADSLPDSAEGSYAIARDVSPSARFSCPSWDRTRTLLLQSRIRARARIIA